MVYGKFFWVHHGAWLAAGFVGVEFGAFATPEDVLVEDIGVVCGCTCVADFFPKYLIQERPVRGIVSHKYRRPSADIPVRNVRNPQLNPRPRRDRFNRKPPKFSGFLNRQPIYPPAYENIRTCLTYDANDIRRNRSNSRSVLISRH
jgi:hypothetical protein